MPALPPSFLLHHPSFPSPGQLKLSVEVRDRTLVLHSEYLPGACGEVAPVSCWAGDGDSTVVPVLQTLWSFMKALGSISVVEQHDGGSLM